MIWQDNLEFPNLTGFTLLLIFVTSCIVPLIKAQRKKKQRLLRCMVIGCGILLYAVVVIVSLQPIKANGSTTVYITNTGTKYHTSDCNHLYRSRSAITLVDAIGEGYKGCKNCDPPTYVPQTIQPSFTDLYDIKDIKITLQAVVLFAVYIILVFLLPYALWKRWKKKRGKQ